jgi:hypothetical protein
MPGPHAGTVIHHQHRYCTGTPASAIRPRHAHEQGFSPLAAPRVPGVGRGAGGRLQGNHSPFAAAGHFKETIPRSRLLAIADEVVTELRLARGGQYQLTEVLLCDAMNRHLFKLLKLPGYRAWCEMRATQPEPPHDPRVIPFRELAPPPSTVAPRAVTLAADAEEGPLACVG